MCDPNRHKGILHRAQSHTMSIMNVDPKASLSENARGCPFMRGVLMLQSARVEIEFPH
jgi:hypothetical protein